MRSSLDVGLPDGTGDDEYLEALRSSVPQVLSGFRADLVFYLASLTFIRHRVIFNWAARA
jgi:acetoin utilization deacetylase AcuC-like enzyme